MLEHGEKIAGRLAVDRLQAALEFRNPRALRPYFKLMLLHPVNDVRLAARGVKKRRLSDDEYRLPMADFCPALAVM